MFTIKVEHAEGVEELFTAKRLHVVHPHEVAGGGTNWDKSGIFLDPEATYGSEGEEKFTLAKHCILFGGDHSASAKERKGGRVFVMNEAGATVAKYIL